MNMFHSARIRLTIWYTVGILFISLLFSIMLYRIITDEAHRLAQIRRVEIQDQMTMQRVLIPLDELYNISEDEFSFVQDAQSRVVTSLLIANTILIFLSVFFSYLLAGKTLEPIETMMNEQNRFISDASHELKTPLTALKSAFEVYLRDKHRTKEAADELVEESITDVDDLTRLTESLLSVFRYANQDREDFTLLNLEPLLTKVVKQMLPLAKKKQITIAPVFVPALIKGDELELGRLFTILLDNAIKYSQTRTTITIVSTITDGSVSIQFSDQGIGIDPKDIAHIFDRFYRVDSSRSRSVHGYGLGLAIAKKIVTIHAGTIMVKSAPGVGSTFTVILPRVKEEKRS